MFWRKKEKATKTAVGQELGINMEELLEKADILEQKLKDFEAHERIHVLNELGSLYFQTGGIEKAIYYYETSLDENKALGKAYTDLIKLYNIKRREAVDAKDEEGTKEYLDKIESLMKLSKDVIRGKS